MSIWTMFTGCIRLQNHVRCYTAKRNSQHGGEVFTTGVEVDRLASDASLNGGMLIQINMRRMYCYPPSD